MQNDDELAKAIKHMRFVEVNGLSDKPSLQLWIISFFTEAYANTDQDTVLFSAEICVVVRNVLEGMVPIKLIWLHDRDFLPDLAEIVGVDLLKLAEEEDFHKPAQDATTALPEAIAILRPHYYPGVTIDGKLTHTSDCAYGCGAWMGGSRSGGPDGVDPFGECPKAPPSDPSAHENE
ncbi:hypothetical protein EKK58_05425 [Candidatus Dependentiae bacterium]|nr:MAG: hypothetical protein EKK58_05425 [Candidatus Dependentiae bacterium]